MDATTGYPDTPTNDKAKAICEFTKWRKSWVRRNHFFTPCIFYWIDYSCLDQDNLEQAVPLMPLWVACCERFLRIEHPMYDSSMWCRLEPLLASAYSFADHQTAIEIGFVNCWPQTGHETNRKILDPRNGNHSDPADMERILPLLQKAEQTLQSKSPRETKIAVVKCFVLPTAGSEGKCTSAGEGI